MPARKILFRRLKLFACRVRWRINQYKVLDDSNQTWNSRKPMTLTETSSSRGWRTCYSVQVRGSLCILVLLVCHPRKTFHPDTWSSSHGVPSNLGLTPETSLMRTCQRFAYYVIDWHALEGAWSFVKIDDTLLLLEREDKMGALEISTFMF